MLWQPSASLEQLQSRADILQKIRHFFKERDVLEVDTPLLCRSTATAPYLSSFTTELESASRETLYLQTSPEFPMKRLLAAGYGDIFQICKAFRNGEINHRHNPEFTILEWYRVGWTHHDLMDEVAELLHVILNTVSQKRISYHDLFYNHFAINPHTCSLSELHTLAEKNNLHFQGQKNDRDLWLDLILTHMIEPTLGHIAPEFIYDYPASQASLARLQNENNYQVGSRFEVYFKGIELANGYHELADAAEQRMRFNEDNAQRLVLEKPVIPIDQFLLSALPTLPDCAGVALGVDRLMALATGVDSLAEVMAFPINRS